MLGEGFNMPPTCIEGTSNASGWWHGRGESRWYLHFLANVPLDVLDQQLNSRVGCQSGAELFPQRGVELHRGVAADVSDIITGKMVIVHSICSKHAKL